MTLFRLGFWMVAVLVRDGRTFNTKSAPADDGYVSVASAGLCGQTGEYEIEIYAIDDEGVALVPATATTTRTIGCQPFMFVNCFE